MISIKVSHKDCTTIARLVIRTPPVYPEVQRDYLIQVFEQELKAGRQCHPRLKEIQNGHVIFESSFKAQYTANCKISYRVICRVPLNDPLFQTDKLVGYLYYSQAAPWASFIPEGYYDNKGYGIMNPM